MDKINIEKYANSDKLNLLQNMENIIIKVWKEKYW